MVSQQDPWSCTSASQCRLKQGREQQDYFWKSKLYTAGEQQNRTRHAGGCRHTHTHTSPPNVFATPFFSSGFPKCSVYPDITWHVIQYEGGTRGKTQVSYPMRVKYPTRAELLDKTKLGWCRPPAAADTPGRRRVILLRKTQDAYPQTSTVLDAVLTMKTVKGMYKCGAKGFPTGQGGRDSPP